jgi:hypothetical protein
MNLLTIIIRYTSIFIRITSRTTGAVSFSSSSESTITSAQTDSNEGGAKLRVTSSPPPRPDGGIGSEGEGATMS